MSEEPYPQIRIFNYLHQSNRTLKSDSNYFVQKNVLKYINRYYPNKFYFYMTYDSTTENNKVMQELKKQYPNMNPVPIKYYTTNAFFRNALDWESLNKEAPDFDIIFNNTPEIGFELLSYAISRGTYCPLISYSHWLPSLVNKPIKANYLSVQDEQFCMEAKYLYNYILAYKNYNNSRWGTKLLKDEFNNLPDSKWRQKVFEKIEPLYLTIDHEEIDMFKPEKIEKFDVPVIVFNHRHNVYTGFTIFMKAIERVISLRPDLKFKIFMTCVGENDRTPKFNVPDKYFLVKESLPYPKYVETLWRSHIQIGTHNGDNQWCYDNITETLTDSGWKLFKDLKYSDKIAQIEDLSKKMFFDYPKNIFEYDYDGEMFELNNSTKQDMCITPNHKLFCKEKNNFNVMYGLKRIDKLYEKSKYRKKFFIEMMRIPRLWKGKEQKYHIVKKRNKSFLYSTKHKGKIEKVYKKTEDIKIPMKDWCFFLGLYLSEGSKTSGRITISQNKYVTSRITNKKIINPQYKIIKTFLKKLPFTIKEHKYETGFSIYNKQLVQDEHLLKEKCLTKYIPRDIMELSSEYLKKLYDGLMIGDGHIGKEHSVYHTTSKRLADDFQELLIKIGYAGVIYSVNPKEDKTMPDGRIIKKENMKTQYSIKISKKYLNNTFGFKPHRNIPYFTKKKYKGKVYCCESNTGLLLVRRNGKHSICGNSMSFQDGMFANLIPLYMRGHFFDEMFEGLTDINEYAFTNDEDFVSKLIYMLENLQHFIDKNEKIYNHFKENWTWDKLIHPWAKAFTKAYEQIRTFKTSEKVLDYDINKLPKDWKSIRREMDVGEQRPVTSYRKAFREVRDVKEDMTDKNIIFYRRDQEIKKTTGYF